MGIRMKACRVLFLAACLTSCASPESPQDAPVPDGAVIYRGLIGRFGKLPQCVEDALRQPQQHHPGLIAALDSYDPLLDELERATRCARCTWTYDSPPSLTEEYPLDYALAAGRLLVVRARLFAKHAALDLALQDMKVLTRFGSDLMHDRPMFGHLSGLVCEVVACDELRAWLRQGRLERTDLEGLEEHLRRILAVYPTFQEWIRMEKEMALPLLREIRDVGISEVLRRVSRGEVEGIGAHPIVESWEEWFRSLLWRDMDRLRRRFSRRWDKLLIPFEKALNEPLNSEKYSMEVAEFKKRSRALSDRMALDLLGLREEEEAITDAADLLFGLWMPASEKITRHHAMARVLLETTALGCRLELVRLKTGSYPEKLSEIVRAPRDPFDGGELLYRRVIKPEGEGYVLAAAGPKGDAEERIRIYSEDCGFDLALFEKKGYGDADSLTFGVMRRSK